MSMTRDQEECRHVREDADYIRSQIASGEIAEDRIPRSARMILYQEESINNRSGGGGGNGKGIYDSDTGNGKGIYD